MIGKTISHYRIVEKLGGGGMGVVYKAKDLKLGRDIALKFLPHEMSYDHEAKERFFNEAHAASTLDHPNICNIHDIDETPEGQIFICMALYEGETLKKKIERGRLSFQEVLRVAIQIAEGLSISHNCGIIHRDIKPANIMVTNRDEVKILDFGLAKLATEEYLTKSGLIMGTISYMSPEQTTGDEIDERADIWSLGVVMYQMFTGQLPFRGDYQMAIVYSILNEEPQPLDDSGNNAPDPLKEIVTKCLEKDPANRYQSAIELKSDLQLLQHNLSLSPPAFREPKLSFDTLAKKYILPIIFTIILILFINPSSRNAIKEWLSKEDFPTEKYIALLPFTNIGNDPQNQEFCDGLVELLSSKITQLEEFHRTLSVLPFSEIRSEGVISAKEAKRFFGVNLVVTGSIQRQSNDVQITINLVDTRNLRQIHSLVINEDTSNVAVLQDSIIFMCTQMLRIELMPDEKQVLTAGFTSVASAYDFYLKGRGSLLQYEKLENIDKAMDLFLKALEKDPQYPLAYAGLGEAYWKKYQSTKNVVWVEQAINYCNKAVKLNDNLAPVLITLGIIHRGTGNYEEALKDFEKALVINPNSYDALRGKAKAYELLGEIEKAERIYQEAIGIKPDYWACYNSLGVFYFKQGRYKDAVEEFQHVIRLTPENIKGYNNLGGLYFHLQDWENSKKMFRRSVSIEPNYVAFSNLGTLFYYSQDFSKAGEMYQKALEISDADFRVWGYLADSFYWQPETRSLSPEKYQLAIAKAKKQLEVNRNDLEVLAYLAGYHARLGQPNQTDSLLTHLIALEPTEPEILFSIGDVYEQLGKRNLGIDWICKALESGLSLVEIEKNPGLEHLLADERFKTLLRELNKKGN
jgi:serine/threonine-protein kinase